MTSVRNRCDRGPCRRCGIDTYAEFCGDCRVADPAMTSGGRTAKQMRDVRTEEHRRWADLNGVLMRVAGHDRPNRNRTGVPA